MTNLAFTLPTWIDILAITALTGLLGCRVWIVPLEFAAEKSAVSLVGSLDHWFAPILATLAVTTVWVLVARTAEMNEVTLAETGLLLPTVVWDTHYGRMWLLRPLALVLIWLGRQALRGRRRRWGSVLAGSGALSLAWCVSGCGHAADSGDFSVAQWVDFVHIVAGTLWGGSLLAGALVLWPALQRGPRQQSRAIRETARRLSTLAAWCLAAVLATGIYNTWQQISSWNQWWTTDYGVTLGIKIALVLVMVLYGAANRFQNLPALADVDDHEPKRGLTHAHWFFGIVGQEAAIAVVALLLVAQLLHLSPPHSADMEHTAEMDHQAASGPLAVD